MRLQNSYDLTPCLSRLEAIKESSNFLSDLGPIFCSIYELAPTGANGGSRPSTLARFARKALSRFRGGLRPPPSLELHYR